MSWELGAVSYNAILEYVAWVYLHNQGSRPRQAGSPRPGPGRHGTKLTQRAAQRKPEARASVASSHWKTNWLGREQKPNKQLPKRERTRSQSRTGQNPERWPELWRVRDR